MLVETEGENLEVGGLLQGLRAREKLHVSLEPGAAHDLRRPRVDEM
jgi:hypothetical protein